MTRISASIKPIELCDAMLIAEHREIKRIPNAIKTGKAKVRDIPLEFTLGTGHVKFFYDKLAFLHTRYNALRTEALRRGFNMSDFSDCFDGLPQELYNQWDPPSSVRPLVLDRINTRLKAMDSNRLKYCGETVSLSSLLLS